MEANIIVFSFNVTFVFFIYIDKPGSAFDFMCRSQGNQSSEVDMGLIQSPLKSLAAFPLPTVNFRSGCIAVNKKIHLKMKLENSCEVSKHKRIKVEVNDIIITSQSIFRNLNFFKALGFFPSFSICGVALQSTHGMLQ